jgi:hypothetical protein
MSQSLYFICFIVLFPTYTWRCHGGHIPSVDRVYDVVGGVVRPAAAGVLGGAGRTLLTPHTLQTLASPSTENIGVKTNIFERKHEICKFTNQQPVQKFLYFQAGNYKEMSYWLKNSALVYEP